MVEVTEFRIGNFIDFYHSISGEIKPTQIWCEWFCNSADINDSFPIPLTPEILEKAGFRIDLNSKKHAGKLYRCQSVTINLETSKIKYVHQLQNFYFALTGEELQIEL